MALLENFSLPIIIKSNTTEATIFIWIKNSKLISFTCQTIIFSISIDTSFTIIIYRG